jgi:hypothetical protein
LPVGLFDLSCRPVTHPDTAEAQAALAHAYAAAGSPIPDAATIGARLWAQSVTRFVGAFNAGDGARAADLLGPDVGAEDLPGYLGHTPGDPGPTPRDFLEWGAVVYTIDLGACGVALENAATTVSCPNLRLGGPLVAALGLDWAPQPTTFEVGFGTIGSIRSNEFGRNRSITGAITGEGDPAPATIDELCRRLRRERPSTAAQSFDGQCSPIYTGAAAAALVAVL